MTPQQLAQAKDPDLIASSLAMQRAAELARQTAVQTGTAIVILQGQQIVRVPAQQLQPERTMDLGSN